MATAAKPLLDLGHRRFGIIIGTRRDNDRRTARVVGVVDPLAARSLQVRAEHNTQVSHGIGDGRDALRHILSADGETPTAILCGTDQLAFDTLIEAEARGLVVPRDSSLAGCNDADYSAFLRPGLTTIRMPSAAIGRAAAEHRLARMANRPAMRITQFDAELIVRGSTAPPR